MKGKVPTGVTAGVLRLSKYGSKAQLEALAGEEEGFDDWALLLEARRRTQKIFEKAYAAGKATEEAVLDVVLALEMAEGRRRVLGEEHKKTLDSLKNMGIVLNDLKDYEGALDYYQQALRGMKKVLGKTHPDTLITTTNIGRTYKDGPMDYIKAEELFR